MAKKALTDDKILSIPLKAGDDVLGAESTDPTFDDVSPRFQRNLARAEQEEQDETDSDLDRDELADDEDDEEEKPVRRAKADAEDEGEEEELEDPSPDEDEDEDEPRNRKDSISKRVARERRLTDEARREAATLRARQDELEARLTAQADEAKFNTFRAETETKIADLRTARRAAIEAGDTDKQDELDDKIGDLKADLRSREREVTAAKEQLKTSVSQRQGSPIVASKVGAWMRKHQRYNTDPSFKAVVNGIDNAVKAAGFNPESDEYYEEIDSRLRKLHPEEYPKQRPRRRAPSEQREPSAQVRRSKTPGNFTIKDGKIRMSTERFAQVKRNMLNFGMDPTNSDDVKEYVLNNRG